MKITLDMKLPGITEWTLAEAVASLKKSGMISLLRSEEDASEHVRAFRRSISRGETPSIGETLAAWYEAKIEELETEMYAEDSIMTNRQYNARLRSIFKVAFQSKR